MLSIIPIVGCTPSITEQKITTEEQKSQCLIATNEYEYASDSYFNQLDSSKSVLGTTIDPGELNSAYTEAQKLVPYSQKVDKARDSKEFWCEKVKPNSILYKTRGYVYLSREAAERSLDN